MSAHTPTPAWALFAAGAVLCLIPPGFGLFLATSYEHALPWLVATVCGSAFGFFSALALCSLPLTRRGG